MKLVYACLDSESELKLNITSNTEGIFISPISVTSVTNSWVTCIEDSIEYNTYHKITAECTCSSLDGSTGTGTFVISGNSVDCLDTILGPFILEDAVSPEVTVELTNPTSGETSSVDISVKLINNMNNNVYMD